MPQIGSFSKRVSNQRLNCCQPWWTNASFIRNVICELCLETLKQELGLIPLINLTEQSRRLFVMTRLGPFVYAP